MKYWSEWWSEASSVSLDAPSVYSVIYITNEFMRVTNSLLLEDVWQQSNKSERRLAFDLQQAGLSHRPPARTRGENWACDQWAPLAWTHAGQWGEADGPSGGLLAANRRLLCAGVCVCVCVALTDWVKWLEETTCPVVQHRTTTD